MARLSYWKPAKNYYKIQTGVPILESPTGT